MSTPPNLVNVLSPPPSRTPMVGGDGLISSPWLLWYQKLVSRVGGSYSDPLDVVTGSVTTLQTNVTTLETGQTLLDGQVATLQASDTVQNAEIATLQADFAGLAGGITVTITTAKITGLGTDGSMTFTNGILISQVQAT